DQGLRAQARDQRRRLQGGGRGRQAQPVARLLAPDRVPPAQGYLGQGGEEPPHPERDRPRAPGPDRGQGPVVPAPGAVQGQGNQVSGRGHQAQGRQDRSSVTMPGVKKIKSEKVSARVRRKVSIRKKIEGTAERPRLSVFRSAKHIYVQAVDDTTNTV